MGIPTYLIGRNKPLSNTRLKIGRNGRTRYKFCRWPPLAAQAAAQQLHVGALGGARGGLDELEAHGARAHASQRRLVVGHEATQRPHGDALGGDGLCARSRNRRRSFRRGNNARCSCNAAGRRSMPGGMRARGERRTPLRSGCVLLLRQRSSSFQTHGQRRCGCCGRGGMLRRRRRRCRRGCSGCLRRRRLGGCCGRGGSRRRSGGGPAQARHGWRLQGSIGGSCGRVGLDGLRGRRRFVAASQLRLGGV